MRHGSSKLLAATRWAVCFLRVILRVMDFEARYTSLNPAQRTAVDTIDGPIMVIAGPGTGKTELLTIRTANILKRTDTLPENILCLTFTESGASAMRERLVGILGKDAYKVAIHTFHSFGSEIINQYGEFFYQGAEFHPADELSRYEIVRSLFDTLGHSNVLNKKMNGEYVYVFEAITVISELKRSGLTSDELLEILDANDHTIEKVEQLLSPVFASKPSKAMIDQLATHIDTIRGSAARVNLPNITPLAQIVADSLSDAVETARESGKTTTITAWRNAWFKKDELGTFIMKSNERQKKLRAISSIYEQYLTRMQEASLYDFDDMILRVVHAMEIFDELRLNLQEKYQYIMVDEFQDTNMAQMRIVHNLTTNLPHGDAPNIMVVGDDDQAIYSFQGADVSNIINFEQSYPGAVRITLTDNYRSGESILEQSRAIITQGTDRLETRDPALNKQLTARTTTGQGTVRLFEAESIADERHWLVDEVATQIKAGTSPRDIAVLTRRHHEIEMLLPYFAHKAVPVQYERRDNVLEQAPVVLLIELARVLLAISRSDYKAVNGMLPELLAHPAWGIAPQTLWRISLDAYNNRQSWIERLAEDNSTAPLQSWLIQTSLASAHTPLELLLDTMMGVFNPYVSDGESEESDPTDTTQTTSYTSPLYSYFFGAGPTDQSDTYVTYLEALRSIRSKLRDYQPGITPTLASFIEFITLHQSIGSGITSVRSASLQDDAVQLMTAHKSKGLEFAHVYVIDALDSVWGERARSRNRMISYPENLPLAPVGDSPDERLRLFYVAATRAKQHLTISYATSDDAHKSVGRAGFLINDQSVTKIKPYTDNESQRERAEVQWYESLTRPVSPTLRELLAPQLERYQLSVTHLTNFLDVSRGGPQTFLLHNLLRFPQAMSPSAAYGSAIHRSLQHAHAHLVATGNRQAVEDVLGAFESALADQRLSEHDHAYFLQKGSEDLQAFLDARYDTFTASQKPEVNFGSQHVMIGNAHLTGALDLIDIDSDKHVTVTDYKTGHATSSWNGKTDYEKIKLHKYKQQLLFYKLLIENARDYRGHTVTSGVLQFVEPTSRGEIVNLETDFDDSELERMRQLISAAWQHITTLDLPDISAYEPTLKGILAFEQDLIDNA